jgi:hypothetical protein
VRRHLQSLHEWHHRDLHHLVQAEGRELITQAHLKYFEMSCVSLAVHKLLQRAGEAGNGVWLV